MADLVWKNAGIEVLTNDEWPPQDSLVAKDHPRKDTHHHSWQHQENSHPYFSRGENERAVIELLIIEVMFNDETHFPVAICHTITSMSGLPVRPTRYIASGENAKIVIFVASETSVALRFWTTVRDFTS